MQSLAEEALCYKVMASAVMQFDVTELPRAIRWDYNHEYTKGSNPQTRDRLYSQLISRYQSDISAIDIMKSSASGSKTVQMSDNEENRKYYSVL